MRGDCTVVKKTVVMLIYGGKSAEHEVSIQSAGNIVSAIPKKYDVCAVYISRSGDWFLVSDIDRVKRPPVNAASLPEQKWKEVFLQSKDGKACVVDAITFDTVAEADVVFPALHGPNGEDGTVQGMLKLLGIPFVGAGVTGSAVGMDKDVMKRLLREAGVPEPRFVVYTVESRGDIRYEDALRAVGSPMFVKPARLGSSVGISRADDAASFESAVDAAFCFDLKIIIEECIDGREIECSVLGSGGDVKTSIPGEIVTRHGFYSYDAKYVRDDEARLIVPADLDKETQVKVKDLAVRTFRVLCCDGMARVDFFIRADTGEVLVNEINTLPGFTSISMYPKLWEASGLSVCELVDRLIVLGLERFKKEKELEETRKRQ